MIALQEETGDCEHCSHPKRMHDADGECWWVSFNPKRGCYCDGTGE